MNFVEMEENEILGYNLCTTYAPKLNGNKNNYLKVRKSWVGMI